MSQKTPTEFVASFDSALTSLPIAGENAENTLMKLGMSKVFRTPKFTDNETYEYYFGDEYDESSNANTEDVCLDNDY